MEENKQKRESLKTIDINPGAFLAAFHIGPYCLRTFCDQGEGPGKNYRISTGEEHSQIFNELMAEFHRINRAQNRGIFFVVNAGGHKDQAITRITAHFVEADQCSLDEQWDNLMAFPLAPSIIVKTRKSLHGYWLMKEDEDGDAETLTHFRKVQKQLAAHFKGDPVISNPSRVMRLPGFYHTKGEPVPVTCLVFEPSRRVTQRELSAALSIHNNQSPPGKKPKTKLPEKIKNVTVENNKIHHDSRWILKNCAFIQNCQENAANLMEPHWYAMITNLAGTQGGEALIHTLSQPDPRYDKGKTDAKIKLALSSVTGPITCRTLFDWGVLCPRRDACKAKCPRDLGSPPLSPWYERHAKGLRLMTGILADCLCRDKHIIYVGEAYYQFINGVYKIVDDNHIKRIIRKQLRVDHVNMSQIKDVQGQLTMLISRSVEKLNPSRHRINLKNGLFNIKTRELSPHDPDYLSTIQMGTAYDPVARAPRFLAFLNECLDRDTQKLVQEILGYLLVPETCAQKAFVFVGEGGAGKSTLLWVVQDLLLGRSNVSNVPWQCLDDRFRTVLLFSMLANIFAVLPSKSIEDNGLFKSITGEDQITAERKNKDPFAFIPTARLLFSCNAIPKNLGDRSDAFYRRLVIVPFLPAKPVTERDPKLKQSFVPEASGIFNWALAGLARLEKNDYRFSESNGSEKALTRYRIDGSSVLSFVEELCVVEETAQTSSTQIYHTYVEYCKESGLRAVSQKRFWTELSCEFSLVLRIKETKTRRIIYKGIKLDESDEFDYM